MEFIKVEKAKADQALCLNKSVPSSLRSNFSEIPGFEDFPAELIVEILSKIESPKVRKGLERVNMLWRYLINTDCLAPSPTGLKDLPVKLIIEILPKIKCPVVLSGLERVCILWRHLIKHG